MSGEIIERIPNLSINGRGGSGNNPIFGGYIYSLDYEVRLGSEGASTVTTSIISPTGNYTISPSDLNVTRVYNITVGKNLTLAMYLKSYKIISSPSGKILELQFIDGSFVLDRTYIGLYKKHGMNPSGDSAKNISVLTAGTQFGNLGNCLIIVGKEHHPCDRNYTGGFDSIKDLQDPCHPCNSDAREVANAALKLVNCKEDVKYNIMPVSYNFTELITALQANGFQLANAKDPNSFYHADYVGELRSVLSSWCADFGWVFFWEKGKIIFKDLRTVINVNANINDFCPNIEQTEEEYTLDGTIQTAVISNYTRPGKGKDTYECQDALHFVIPPYNQQTFINSPLAISRDIDETAAGWSLYSSELRVLYYWFIKYQMGLNQIYPTNFLKELGLLILSNPIYLPNTGNNTASTTDGFSSIGYGNIDPERNERGNVIPFLRSKSSGPYSAVKRAINGNKAFKKCFELLTIEDQWKLAADADNKYFFIAYWDEDLERQFEEGERSYASSFMGKYHVFAPDMNDSVQAKFFEDYNFIHNQASCQSNVYKNDSRLQYDAIDINNGSMRYYNNGNPSFNEPPPKLSELPFADFLSIFRDSGYSNDTTRAFKLIEINKTGNDYFPGAGVKRVEADDDDPPKYNINNGNLISAAFSFYPKKIQTPDNKEGQNIISELLGDNDAGNVDKGKVAIFLGTLADGFSMQIVNSVNEKTEIGKPFDGKPLDPNLTDDPSLTPETVYQYPNLRCLPLGSLVNYCFRYYLDTPSGQFWFDAPSYANYGVVIEKTKQVAQKLKKVETVMQSGSCPGPQVLRFNVNAQNITDQTIDVIKRIDPNSQCSYDLTTIEKVHKSFVQNLSLNQNVPLVRKSFTIDGIDIAKTPTIDDGLLGVKITVGDNGVKTTYTFGTTEMKIPAKPEVYQYGLLDLNQGTISDTYGQNALNNKTGGGGSVGPGVV